MKPAKFVFVDQSGGSDTREALQSSRKRIRSQARLHTISRWKQGRMQNLQIQLVKAPEEDETLTKVRTPRTAGSRSRKTSLQESKCISEKSSPHNSDENSQRAQQRLSPDEIKTEHEEHKPFPGILWDVPLNGYEKARSKYNFELNWLSALAVNHVGRAPTDDNPAIPSFHRTTVHDWLDLRENSFLELIPTMYDFSPLIQDLVEAMLMKARHTLTDEKNEKASEQKVLLLYGKALRGVQEALIDDDTMHSPETLCATQLIQLYELLDFGPPQIWIAHTNGIHQLIKLRGPKRFATRLERSLLCTQLQHIFSQAFMNNTDCFLEQAAWQDLLQQMIDDLSSVCREVQVKLWRTIACLPRLLRQTSEYVLQRSSILDCSLLLNNLRILRDRLAAWRISFLKLTLGDIQLGPASWNSLYGVSLSIHSIVNRLIIALSPYEPNAIQLEDETQEFAAKLMGIRTGKIVTSGFYIGMIALATRDEWTKLAHGDQTCIAEDRAVVKSCIWSRWNAMMGRRDGVYGTFWPRPKR